MARSMKPSNERRIRDAHKTVTEPQWTFSKKGGPLNVEDIKSCDQEESCCHLGETDKDRKNRGATFGKRRFLFSFFSFFFFKKFSRYGRTTNKFYKYIG